LRTPKDYGMNYEDIFFPSLDGTRLDGWLIPADSDKIIICNHFAPGNRYGFPGHIKPWNQICDFEVNFLPQYKALHEAGYNVIAYDLRNHGRSDSGSGGLMGLGLIEYRDVIGSIRYVRSRKDTQHMDIGLRSVCIGLNSTMVAMNYHPEYFDAWLRSSQWRQGHILRKFQTLSASKMDLLFLKRQFLIAQDFTWTNCRQLSMQGM